MHPEVVLDEDLIRRLPLPLATLYRRAYNAKTSLERQLAAYYLWEAALKLLGSVAIIEYAERGGSDPNLVARLQNLARPKLGNWWEFVRGLLPALAAQDESFRTLREVILGRARSDFPRAASLDAALQEIETGDSCVRSTLRIEELFNRLIDFRNREIGHGAAGQRPREFYDRMSRALFDGIVEILSRVDVLAGRRLMFIADIRRLASGSWLVERYELVGETARRLASIELPSITPTSGLPQAHHVYAIAAEEDATPGSASEHRSLHPLLLYDADQADVYILNARRGEQGTEYLSYSSGQVIRRNDLGRDQCQLLARVLGTPVDSDTTETWAAQSLAEEPATPEPTQEARRRIGEFEMLGRIDAGGMGVVYRAWQLSLGRQVALKSLFRSGDPKAEARFAREIRALGRVDHPHLIKIHTSGVDGDQWFYTMELIEGSNLASICGRLGTEAVSEVDESAWQQALSQACEETRGREEAVSQIHAAPERQGPADRGKPAAPLEADFFGKAAPRGGAFYIGKVVDYVRQAAEAAQALHEAGVIHRDIKPGNIMVTADGGRAILMDLGLAQLADDAEGKLTRTRQFVGTLRYASPEQLLAADKLDRRSDVYGLGATLWELLTLRPLFGADERVSTPDLMLKIQSVEPERPRRFNPNVPVDLEAIVLKCLEKPRERRYANAADLAADLARWQRGDPVIAQPPTLRYVLQKHVQRYRFRIAAAAALFLLLLAGLGAGFWKVNRERQEAVAARARAQAEQRRADQQRRLAELASEDSRRQRDEARRQGSIAERASREAQQERDRTRRTSAGLAADRGIALCESGEIAQGLLWLVESLELASGSSDLQGVIRGNLDGWRRRLSTLALCLQHDDLVRAVAFSPDGQSVLTGSEDRTARLWDASTGALLATFPHDGPVRSVAFNAAGTLILTGSEDKSARLWDTKTRQPVGEPFLHLASVRSVAFSPDGNTILTGGDDNVGQRWDLATGRRIDPPLAHEDQVQSVAFSPNGSRILTGSDDDTAKFWDADSGKLLQTLAHEDSVLGVAFSPDGARCVTGCFNQTAQVFDLPAGTKVGPPLKHLGPVRTVAYGPNDIVLTGSWDTTARVWNVNTGQPIGHPFSHQGQIYSVAFGPNGEGRHPSYILTGGWDKSARVWRAARPEGGLISIEHRDTIRSVAFGGNGKLLATASEDKTVRLWDMPSGHARGQPLVHEDCVYAVAFHPDGHTIATGGKDTYVRQWDVVLGSQVAPPVKHEGEVYAVAYSPDGNSVVSGCNANAAKLWKAATGELLAPPMRHEGRVGAVAFSPDGQILATGGWDSFVRLWNGTTGQALGSPLKDESPVASLAFSPDGRRLLTGVQGGTATLWDLATRQRVGGPFRHTGVIWSVAFSPDGRQVATASGNGSARIWDVETQKTLGPPLVHRGAVHDVKFSQDGRSIVTASMDCTARLWEVPRAVEGAVERIRYWVQVITGMELPEDHVPRVLNATAWEERRQRLEAFGGSP